MPLRPSPQDYSFGFREVGRALFEGLALALAAMVNVDADSTAGASSLSVCSR